MHARSTGEALSAIDPDYIGILTLMSEPGTLLYERVQKGEFVVPSPLQLLLELREMIDACEVANALLRTNHAPTTLPFGGHYPRTRIVCFACSTTFWLPPSRLGSSRIT